MNTNASEPRRFDLILIILLGRQLADVPRGHNTLKNLVMYNSYITIITYIKLKSDSLLVKSSISIVSIIAIGKLFHSLIVLG